LELARSRALKVSYPPISPSTRFIKHELTPSPPITASIPEHQRTAWKKYHTHPFATAEDFEKEVVRHVETTLARSMFNCDETAAYAAASLAFRNRLITEWNRTQQRQTFADGKRVYYLSLEFLMGRALDNAMLNVGLKNVAKGGFPVYNVMAECTNMEIRGIGGLGLPYRGYYRAGA